MTGNRSVACATLLAVATLLPGCTMFEGPIRRDELKNMKTEGLWVSYDATRRGSLVLPEEFKGRVLSEQLPDAVMTSSLDFLAKVTSGKVEGEASVKYAQAVTELGKVTTGVKFLREALYRLNESAINGTIQKEDNYVVAMKEILNLSAAVEKTKQIEAMRDLVKELQDAKALTPENGQKLLDQFSK